MKMRKRIIDIRKLMSKITLNNEIKTSQKAFPALNPKGKNSYYSLILHVLTILNFFNDETAVEALKNKNHPKSKISS